MKQQSPSDRYRATDELRRQLRIQGRKATWVASQIGASRSKMSKVVAGRHTLAAHDARVLAALLGVDFSLLFELPNGSETVLKSDSLPQHSEAA